MPLVNCKKCRKLFNSVTRPICPDCLKEEEELLKSVQKYIRENPKSTVDMVSEAMDLEKAVILKFIREKRIIFSSQNSRHLNCSCCGAPVQGGTLCSKCRNKLTGSSKKEDNPNVIRSTEHGDRRISIIRERHQSSSDSDSMIKDRFKR